MPEHHVLNPAANLCTAEGFNAMMEESCAGGWAAELPQMRLLTSAVAPLGTPGQPCKGPGAALEAGEPARRPSSSARRDYHRSYGCMAGAGLTKAAAHYADGHTSPQPLQNR